MPKTLDLEQTYTECVTGGSILPQDKVDIHKIQSMLPIIEEYMKSAEDMKAKNSFNVRYDLAYSALHMLTEAFLLFDEVEIASHQCLFAALCIRHPELDLDWNFFEKIRMKREGIHHGAAIRREDWVEIDIQSKLYAKTLSQALKEKISQHKRG
ncbi:MAG: hypothetical protein V1735_07680 [Nanoarchaeota archaeon]